MKLQKPLLIIFIVAFILGLWFAFSRSPQAPASDKPLVAATIFPIYDIARNVAGDAIDVRLVLPPGAEPHGFDPSPSLLRAMQGVQVMYAVGHGLDGWVNIIADATGSRVTTVDSRVMIRPSTESTFVDQPESGTENPDDPHYWLTIPNAKLIAMNIATDLSTRYPTHRDEIASHLKLYLTSLDQADADIRTTLADLPSRNIITFHDAWYYFGEEYGLRVVGTFEPAPNREPSPQYLVALAKAVYANTITALYTEPLFGSAAIDAFAQDENLRVAALDDIGGTPERASYIDLMLSNAQTIRDNQ